ncbi:hypothetical protein ACFQ3Z_04375 [Streptomyces nogalater]
MDSSVTALWPPLITGGRVHLVPREDAADPARMRELFARYAFDHLKITPSHFAALQGWSRASRWSSAVRTRTPRRWRR